MARPGMDAAALEDFLARVDEVQSQITGLKDGTLEPEKIVIPEEEERKAKEAAEKKRRDEEEKAERMSKEEERTKWWEYARVRVEGEPADAGEDGKEAKEAKEEDAPAKSKPARIGLDYAKWDKWVANPDDPVTKEEAVAREAEIQRMQDAEFEKLNPDFCSQFKEDLERRKKADAKRRDEAFATKDKGNMLFKAKKYREALRMYHKALRTCPFEIPFLTNIAQAHIKLEEWDDAAEFCTRALYLDTTCIKALFRRAVARRAQEQYDDAIADLEAATVAEPANIDLQRELERTRVAKEEARKEQDIAARLGTVVGGSPAGSSTTTPSDAKLTTTAPSASDEPTTSADSSGDAGITSLAKNGPGKKAQRAAGTRSGKHGAKSKLSPLEKCAEATEALKSKLLPADKGATSILNIESELQELGRSLGSDDAHVYFRSSGVLALLCGALAAQLSAVTKSSPSPPSSSGSSGAGADADAGAEAFSGASSKSPSASTLHTSAEQRVALMLISSTVSNPANRDVVRSSGLLRAVVDSAAEQVETPFKGEASGGAGASAASGSAKKKQGKTGVPAAFLLPQSVLAAALCMLELVASERDDRDLNTICRTPKFVSSLLGHLLRFVTDQSTDPEIGECAAHAASLIQTLASGTHAAPLPRVETALASLVRPVEILLRVVVSMIGRSVVEQQSLTSLLMQGSVGALANLAQKPDLRPAFAAVSPGASSAGGATPKSFLCRALLDLQRLPMPESAEWTVVRGSALAALCNAGLDQTAVLDAIQSSDAVDILLDELEGHVVTLGRPSKVVDVSHSVTVPDVIAARAANLLARLTQHDKALAELQTPARLSRVVQLLVSAKLVNTGYVDALVRVLAAAIKTSAQAALYVEKGGIEAASGVYRSAIAKGSTQLSSRLHVIGNLTKILISVAGPSDAGLQNRLLLAGIPDHLVDVLKRAPDGPVRKNAAVALARMARHTPSRERIRDLRGLEVMIQLGSTLVGR